MVNFNAAGVDVSPKELQVCVPSDRDEKCKRTFGVYKVKIEGLGTFYCTLENQKGGAEKKEDFNVSKHLRALHIRFLPEQEAEQNISSREFLKKAEFINIEQWLKSLDEQAGGNSGSDSSNSEGGGNSGGSGGSEPSGSDTGGDDTTPGAGD